MKQTEMSLLDYLFVGCAFVVLCVGSAVVFLVMVLFLVFFLLLMASPAG